MIYGSLSNSVKLEGVLPWPAQPLSVSHQARNVCLPSSHPHSRSKRALWWYTINSTQSSRIRVDYKIPCSYSGQECSHYHNFTSWCQFGSDIWQASSCPAPRRQCHYDLPCRMHPCTTLWQGHHWGCWVNMRRSFIFWCHWWPRIHWNGLPRAWHRYQHLCHGWSWRPSLTSRPYPSSLLAALTEILSPLLLHSPISRSSIPGLIRQVHPIPSKYCC